MRFFYVLCCNFLTTLALTVNIDEWFIFCFFWPVSTVPTIKYCSFRVKLYKRKSTKIISSQYIRYTMNNLCLEARRWRRLFVAIIFKNESVRSTNSRDERKNRLTWFGRIKCKRKKWKKSKIRRLYKTHYQGNTNNEMARAIEMHKRVSQR